MAGVGHKRIPGARREEFQVKPSIRCCVYRRQKSSPAIISAPESFYSLAVAVSQALANSPDSLSPDVAMLGTVASDVIPALHAAVGKIDSGALVITASVKQMSSEGVLSSIYYKVSIEHVEDHVEQSQTTFGPGLITCHPTKTIELQKTPINDNVFIIGLKNVTPPQEYIAVSVLSAATVIALIIGPAMGSKTRRDHET